MDRSVGETLSDPARLAAVRRLRPVTGRHAAALDRLAEAAAALLDAPLGLVTLLDESEHHMTAASGHAEWVGRGSVLPARGSYCPHTLAAGAALLVDDTRADDRFAALPACVDGGFLGYAGAPIAGPGGHLVGTLCVLDKSPRRWTARDRQVLEQLAGAAGATVCLLVDGQQREGLLAAFDDAPAPVAVLRGPLHRLEYANPQCRAALGPAPLGVPAAMAYPALEQRGLIRILDGVFATGHPYRTRRTRLPGGASGADRFFTVSYSRITDDDGLGSGVLAIGTDITDRVHRLRDLERRAGRERSVARAAETLTRSADPRAALAGIPFSVVPALADASSVYLLDPPVAVGSAPPLHTRRVAVAQGSGPAVGPESVTVQWAGGDPVSEAVRTGRPVRSPVDADAPPSWARRAGVAPLLRDRRVHTVVTVPVCVRDLVVAVLSFVAFAGRPPYDDDDLAAQRRVAAEVAAALDHDEAHRRTRDIAMALQRSMLTDVPSVAGLTIGACYRPAGPDAEVGGDWYDAFPLPDGGLGVAVGDVVGHDIAGAAAMGQLRSMLRALAFGATRGPAATLDELDRLTVGLGITRFATAVHGRITHAGGAWDLEWANAGQPPPVLLTPDGAAVVLDPPSGAALGVGSAGPPSSRATAHLRLPAGSTLLLYTDGLVERRDASIDGGIAALTMRAAQLAGLAVQDLCDALTVGAPAADDVALLAICVGSP